MKKWGNDIRGAALMILVWIIGWGLGFGGLMELVDRRGEFGDVWPPALALAGFLGGVVFCGLLRMGEGRRSFDEVSLGRAAVWGVVSSLALAAVGISKVAGPLSSVISHVALGMAAAFGAGEGQRGFVALGVMATLGVVAAIGSMVFFRVMARRQAAVASPRG